MTQQLSSPAVSVVVPLFNEEESIGILQSELSAALKDLDYETIFVDDGSVDRTVERIEPKTNVRIIRFEKNTGQSAAIYAGLRAARGATAVLIEAICKMIQLIFQSFLLKLRAAPISSAAIGRSVETRV